jgi:hypothetical protein
MQSNQKTAKTNKQYKAQQKKEQHNNNKEINKEINKENNSRSLLRCGARRTSGVRMDAVIAAERLIAHERNACTAAAVPTSQNERMKG